VSLPQVIIDVGFTSPTVATTAFILDDPVRGKLDGPPTLADENIWSDITDSVRSWSITRGSHRGDDPTLRYDTGIATIILNDENRDFDPDNLSGPYVAAGVTQIEPMRRVRIRAVWAGVTYPIFYGYADDFQADYQGNSWTYTTLTASDALKVFASYDRGAATPAGAGENAGARVTRILDGIGWSSADRVVATGNTTLQATDLSGNALSELLLVQDTELGELYADASGRIVFRNRNAVLTNTRSTTSQATFGDGGFSVTGEIPYADVVPSSLDEAMANTVTAQNTGGTAQTVIDGGSVTQYLTKTFQRTDLIAQTDGDALSWAQAVVYQYSSPRRRFASITFNTPRPEAASAHWPAVLGREFGDRVTINRRPAGGGTISRDCFIRGVQHESDGVSWKTTWVLQAADRYSFFVLDDAILGRLDNNALSY